MYGKLFQQMYEGTLVTRGPWQALVTFQQMIVLCDKNGVIDMTAEAISRRTTIPLEIIQDGITHLEQPDKGSRTPDEEGRRIVRLRDHTEWGWRIVNYLKYRSLQREEGRADYHRRYYHDVRKVVETGDKPQSDSTRFNNSQHVQPSQPIAEAEAKADAEAELLHTSPPDTKVTGAQKRAGAAKRGARIPDPFVLTAEMRAWAAEECPGVDVQAVTREFVDYWRGVPGQRGCKLDWPATWRNRVRDKASKPGTKVPVRSKAKSADQLEAEEREREQQRSTGV